MTGRIRFVYRYSPSMARNDPHTLYVFGDNMQRRGRGGQAIIRDLPNAFGIPTKNAPSYSPSSYFTDADLPRILPILDECFAELADHLDSGGDVVWPEDGIGTGLAELPQRAPAIHRAILARLKDMLDHAP